MDEQALNSTFWLDAVVVISGCSETVRGSRGRRGVGSTGAVFSLRKRCPKGDDVSVFVTGRDSGQDGDKEGNDVVSYS